MSTNDFPEHVTGATRNGPGPRRPARKLLFLLLLLAAILLLSFVLLGTWKVLKNGGNNLGIAQDSEHHKAKGQVASNPDNFALPAIYWETIQQQVAQGLHLTVAQVKTSLHCNASICPGIAEVATARDIYPTQLHTIEMHAIQVAADQLVRMGKLTQQQADEVVKYWQQQDCSELDRHITSWLLEDW